jgi:hypothetical protein
VPCVAEKTEGCGTLSAFVIVREVFIFHADTWPSRFFDFPLVHVVVVNPACVARVVSRVNANALHLAAVARQQGFERVQIVALNQQIALARRASRKFFVAVNQAIRHFYAMPDDSVFFRSSRVKESLLFILLTFVNVKFRMTGKPFLA